MKLNNKGLTVVEFIFVVIMMGIFAVMTYSGGSSLINASKMSVLQHDLSSLENACIQLMQMRDGLTNTAAGTDASEFAKMFNECVDSNQALNSSTGEMNKTDPWGVAYTVRYNKINASESTILIESKGKLNPLVNNAMLVHYKSGEVRIGTAGFENNKGADTSNAAFTDSAGATITTMWSSS